MTADITLFDILPANTPIFRFVDWARKTTDAHVNYHVGVGLTLAAYELCRHGVVIHEELCIPPILWTFLIGVPASGKSTAIRRGQLFLRTMTKTAEASDTDPFFFLDGSLPGIWEGLAERYDHKTETTCAIAWKDEGAQVLVISDAIAEFLCHLIDGQSVTRSLRSIMRENRKRPNSVPSSLKSPRVCGLLASTASSMSHVAKPHFFEGGLFSRFLWIVGPNFLEAQSFMAEMHLREMEQAAHAWGLWTEDLAYLQKKCIPVIQLAAEAYEYVQDEIINELNEKSAIEQHLNAIRKRSAVQALVIAAIFATQRRDVVIKASDIIPAVTIAKASVHGFANILPLISSDEVMKQAKKILELIEKKKEIARHEIYQVVQKPVAIVEQAIQYLIEARKIEAEVVQTKGRPRTIYRMVE